MQLLVTVIVTNSPCSSEHRSRLAHRTTHLAAVGLHSLLLTSNSSWGLLSWATGTIQPYNPTCQLQLASSQSRPQPRPTMVYYNTAIWRPFILPGPGGHLSHPYCNSQHWEAHSPAVKLHRTSCKVCKACTLRSAPKMLGRKQSKRHNLWPSCLKHSKTTLQGRAY